MEGELHTLHVWGPLACFTRPEAKVERLSYPVITPSAARGIFDAILWQPGLRWQLTRIELLAPIRTVELRRNEVKQRVPRHDKILRWAKGLEPVEPIVADLAPRRSGSSEKGRTQRQTVALRDVAYRLQAQLLSPDGDSLRARDEQFRRRVAKGQCLHQPFFGQKEMVAYFRFPVPDDPAPLPIDFDLGLMLYDPFPRPPLPTGEPSVTLFHARLHKGVLTVPRADSAQVLRAGSV